MQNETASKQRLIPTTDPELIALCDNQSQRQRKRHGYVVMRDRPGTFMAWVRAEVVQRLRSNVGEQPK